MIARSKAPVTAAAVVLAVVAAMGISAASAAAGWSNGGNGAGAAAAKSMPAGNQPTATVANRNVTVTWNQSSFQGGPAVNGYVVKRYDTNGQSQNIGSGCSGTISGLSCTEQAVPSGSWKYSVTPKQGNWSGTESQQSSSVSVGSPNLSFSSSTTVTSLPATLSGSISNFVSGQSVSFRLDNPNTGMSLSGSITPSPVPNNGSASVSVTIPAGTSNGSHTVYAIGNNGDVASAGVTVSVSLPMTSSAWDVRDASTGTESNTSAIPAFANDGRTGTSGNFATTFSSTRYVQFDYYSPLPSGGTVASMNFNFRFAASRNGDNTCFYFDVRRASTGAVLATHGDATNPVACNSTLTYSTSTTALPEVTTSDVANDLRIRIYVKNTASRAISTDLATVTGTYSAGGFSNTGFTLYDAIDVDAASGTPQTFPWGLAAGNDTGLTNAYSSGTWAASFSATRYLKFTLPSNVPAGATITQASLDHAYKSLTAGANTCYYFEVYSGATLLGTHGSASNPVSCNSTSSFATDNIALPEVDTAAKANGLIVKMYVRNSAASNSQHDLLRLNLKYK